MIMTETCNVNINKKGIMSYNSLMFVQ